jgi:signal transduction histidine kinase
MVGFFWFSLPLAALLFFLLKERQKKNELLPYQIAHELKAPLTILQGYAEVLLHLEKLSPKQAQEIGNKILAASLRMDRIVSAFMMLAGEERYAKKADGADLFVILKKSRDHLLQIHSRACVQIPEKKEPLLIAVEEPFLEIILSNLLENAARYSPAGALIRISVEEKKKSVLLSVTDQGVGLLKQHRSRIFKSFYSADKELSRKHGGWGLGLFIVKKILQKTRGKISVQSTLGEGTTFSLTLPKKRS